jgi:hypothetical protein
MSLDLGVVALIVAIAAQPFPGEVGCSEIVEVVVVR